MLHGCGCKIRLVLLLWQNIDTCCKVVGMQLDAIYIYIGWFISSSLRFMAIITYDTNIDVEHVEHVEHPLGVDLVFLRKPWGFPPRFVPRSSSSRLRFLIKCSLAWRLGPENPRDWWGVALDKMLQTWNMGLGQNLLVSILMGWTSISPSCFVVH